jgi:tRNA dimethylallyltransferase
MITKKKYVITIVGTTAIGKTALGIKLAKHFNTEIISVDSRQFFKEMTIGTAVPTKEELGQASHHFIQNLSIFDQYSVGDFEKDALQKIKELHKKYDVILLLGGSGLYVDAVLKGLDYFPKVDAQIRKNLKTELEEKGIEKLQNQLKKLDLQSYKNIEISNPQRLIRALEICISSGKPYSSFLNKKQGKRDFISIKIGLTAERETIYNRINQRVDIMIKNGLVDEAKKLHEYKHLNALQTVGYRELFSYFDNEISLDFAIEEIKKNTRRFAKRQVTWFKRDDKITWFDYQDKIENITGFLESKINKF